MSFLSTVKEKGKDGGGAAEKSDDSSESIIRKPEVPEGAISCVALWNFAADDQNAIRLRKGEEVLLIKEEYAQTSSGLKERWKRALVQTKSGQRGFVARSYLEKVHKVIEHHKIFKNTWYIGETDIEQAGDYVSAAHLPIGAFVICAPNSYRRSFGHRNYALVLRTHQNKSEQVSRTVNCYRIDRDLYGRYYIKEGEKFANLFTLVKCLGHPVSYLPTKLVCGPKIKQDLVLLDVPAPPKRMTVDKKYLQQSKLALGRDASIRKKHGKTMMKMGPWFMGKARLEEARQRLHDRHAKPGKFVIFAPASDYETNGNELTMLLKVKDADNQTRDKQFKVNVDNDGYYFVTENQKHKTLAGLAAQVQQQEVLYRDRTARVPSEEQIISQTALRAQQMVEERQPQSHVTQDAALAAAEEAVHELQTLPDDQVSTAYARLIATSGPPPYTDGRQMEPEKEKQTQRSQLKSAKTAVPQFTKEKEAQIVERIAAKVADLLIAQKIIGAEENLAQTAETAKAQTTRDGEANADEVEPDRTGAPCAASKVADARSAKSAMKTPAEAGKKNEGESVRSAVGKSTVSVQSAAQVKSGVFDAQPEMAKEATFRAPGEAQPKNRSEFVFSQPAAAEAPSARSAVAKSARPTQPPPDVIVNEPNEAVQPPSDNEATFLAPGEPAGKNRSEFVADGKSPAAETPHARSPAPKSARSGKETPRAKTVKETTMVVPGEGAVKNRSEFVADAKSPAVEAPYAKSPAPKSTRSGKDTPPPKTVKENTLVVPGGAVKNRSEFAGARSPAVEGRKQQEPPFRVDPGVEYSFHTPGTPNLRRSGYAMDPAPTKQQGKSPATTRAQTPSKLREAQYNYATGQGKKDASLYM